MFYRMNIAGVERDLPLCPLNEELYIGAFVMFGDVELTVRCAEALCKKKNAPSDKSNPSRQIFAARYDA